MINPLFRVHKLNEAGLKNAQLIAEAFTDLTSKLALYCYPGREFSIVCTKLEEAAFFAKKSIANNPMNQAE